MHGELLFYSKPLGYLSVESAVRWTHVTDLQTGMHMQPRRDGDRTHSFMPRRSQTMWAGIAWSAFML